MSASGAAMGYPDDLLVAGVLSRRIWAWVLDLVFLAIIGAIVASMLVAFGLLTFGLGFHLWPLLGLLPFIYHVGFLCGRLSATPGQAVAGLIMRRNDDLGSPSLAQAIVWTLGFYITVATGIGLLFLLVCLLTVRRRTLHDLVSGLVLVRRYPPSGWTPYGGAYGGPAAR